MRVRHSRRTFAASAAVLVLLASAGVTSPASADTLPILAEWSVAVSTSTPEGVTAAWDVGETDGIADIEFLDPFPVMRPRVVNGSAETRHFGFGIDVGTQGDVEPMWQPSALDGWSSGLEDEFWFTLEPGESAAEIGQTWSDGAPRYAGRTVVIYELSEPPSETVTPTATALATLVTPGGFVPVYFGGETTGDDMPPAGQKLTVVGAAGPTDAPEIFPGVAGTVQASGLPANLAVDLYVAPDFDYFFFILLGGNLPSTALHAGSALTAADGSLSATFTVPPNAQLGMRYQIVAGVRSQHYWPAGTYTGVQVVTPTQSALSETPAGASVDTITVGPTQVRFAFPDGTTAGTTTATISSTGPVPNEFSLFGGSNGVYYHLDSTATPGGPVEVCITYDTDNFPGDPPYLWHHEPVPAGQGWFRWVNITSSRTPGEVCGLTTSFSPFALGFPTAPPDDGSKAKPAVGVLQSDNGWDTGLADGDYNVVMNLWWGENARLVRLYENNALVAEQTLTRNSPNAQKATFPISGKPNGTYVYKAELENSRGVTTTQPITVKVTQANPGTPVLSHDNWSQQKAFTLTANMWWGTNATSYRFLEGATVLGQGTLTAATPNAQKATLALTNVSKGTHTYRVEFTNAAGTTTSTAVQVQVK